MILDSNSIGLAKVRVVDIWSDNKGETFLRLMELEDCEPEKRLYAMYNFSLEDYIQARNNFLNK